MTKIPRYISNLIDSGESQTLDFKFEISDSSKIAKTLSAFANTEGGILLIGVKDNGKIAGIRTNEEIFMLENAAIFFCKPKIKLDIKLWNINGKQILEAKIAQGTNRPYFAKDHNNKWKAYIRVKDQNHLANTVFLKYWKNKNKNIQIQYTRKEQLLLQYLKDFNTITLNKYQKLAQISRQKATSILADFMSLDLIEAQIDNKNNICFSLK
jgi:predicted HTH transcriptional regulator